jgi:aminopeptidase N
MLRSLFTCIGLVCLFHANAQNFYRSQQNPHYWKNRLPRAGFWQQDVQYKIKAAVNEKTMVITGQEELTYWNNSPDTLKFVYFHLYQNAFQPGSYAHSLNVNNGNPPKYGGYESRKLGSKVSKIESKGKLLQTELDNTILKS